MICWEFGMTENIKKMSEIDSSELYLHTIWGVPKQNRVHPKIIESQGVILAQG